MIERYARPQMQAIWTDEGRFRRWLDVELAVSDELAERGVIPAERRPKRCARGRASMPRASPRSSARCATT